MLIIKQLSIKNDQQGITLVDNLSFTLNTNDKIAIIGTEGSGKSTLLDVIAGKNLAHISVSGEINRPAVVGYVKQNLISSCSDITLLEFFQSDPIDVVIKLFSQFDLAYLPNINRPLKSFSGGQIIKLGLIKTLALNPDILLLDEPSNDLDFQTLNYLENFLIDLKIPLLFVSHDQRLLENVSNGIIHLSQIHKKTKPKTTFLRLDYETFKETYSNNYYSKMAIARKQRSDYQQKMQRFNQIYQKVCHQQNQAVRNPGLGSLLKKKMRNLKSQEKRYLKEKESFIQMYTLEEPLELFFEKIPKVNPNKTLINLDIKDFTLPDGKVISNLKLDVNANTKLVITGENGCGKTTLIKYLAQTLDQNNIKYGYLSQNYLDILNVNLNATQFILSKTNKYTEPKIRTLLGALGLKTDEMICSISSLSEGTKLKVLLLLLVVQEIEILLLDEPTRNLSALNQDQLYHLFSEFNGAIVAISHDRTFIETVFDDVYQLDNRGLTKLT